MDNRRLLWAGLALGIIAAGLIFVRMQSLEAASHSAPFLKLAPDSSVAQGGLLDEAQLERISLPASAAGLSQAAIADTEENRQWLLRQPAARDIAGGSMLLYQDFSTASGKGFGSSITPGKRAMSIPTSPTSAVGFLVAPGSRVDILGTFATTTPDRAFGPTEERLSNTQVGQAALVTTTVLQNVRVFAVGSATTPAGYAKQGAYDTVTVEVTPSEAEQLLFSMQKLQGQFALLLRNPTDENTAEIPKLEWKSAQP